MPRPINRIHTLKPREITDPGEPVHQWVVTNQHDENGTMRRVINLDATDCLTIEGHDLGRGVEDALGFREYEFERTLSAEETARLRQLMGVEAGGDLLAMLRTRFTSTFDFEQFLAANELSGQFWSRRGD